MSDLRTFLHNDPLAQGDRSRRRQEVSERFSPFLGESEIHDFYGVLWPFVHKQPFRYWDTAQVVAALNLLEKSRERTLQALQVRAAAIGIGVDNMHRLSPARLIEESLSHAHASELIRIATEINPEYLRCAEHVFGNLIQLYWSVAKRGSVEGKFVLRRATEQLRSMGHNILLTGFVDRIRNAIAHGELTFTAMDIRVGPKKAHHYLSSDYLREHDGLWRTCVALLLGLYIFIIREAGRNSFPAVPPAIVTRLAAGRVNRPGLEVVGAVESEILGRSQLHVAIRSPFLNRQMLLGESARVALHLIENGATDYDRFLIEIDSDRRTSSLVIIRAQVLRRLLRPGTPVERLPEAYEKTQLLWHNEGPLRTRLKAWSLIVGSALRQAKHDMLRIWQESGLALGSGRFWLRDVKNASAGGFAQLNVTAVLKNPADADDRSKINNILFAIVRRLKWKLIDPTPSSMDRKWSLPRLPKRIGISLHREDGPLRWLQSGGWQGGNVVAVAEFLRGDAKPARTVNAQQEFRGLRIRYEIDHEMAADLARRVGAIVSETRERLKQRGNHDDDAKPC